ncbi:MAG: hypothetical protein QGI33_01730, partial [Candidatus Brocadiia bacterium]|nr:hypothetical protein [Candidatus Brocadiia bacterium]
MDEYPWWQETYAPVLDLIENDEIYWVTVLYSLGTAVDQEDVTRWHDTFPHHKIIVLGKPGSVLRCDRHRH